jgi:exodeoxyribonuclease III
LYLYLSILKMKLATWNINSLTVRLPHVLSWLASHPVDVLCLQELKLPDEKFPRAAFEAIGYRSVFAGQKTYNGVAIMLRNPVVYNEVEVVRGIPGFDDPQQRLIAVTLKQTQADVRIVCGYFPNGQAPDAPAFAYKLRWIDALCVWLVDEIARYPQLALLGDYNIAPEQDDVHDPVKWAGSNLVSPAERAAFSQLTALGLTDAFRCFTQPPASYTWWDYRARAYQRNAGLRIDHILLTAPLAARCQQCIIDPVPRSWVRPSDHVPVIAMLKQDA